MGSCHDGAGGAEGGTGVMLEVDVVIPEEGKAVVQDGWLVCGIEAGVGMVEGYGCVAHINGVTSCS